MITLKYIRKHFKDNGYEPRHCFKGLKSAANRLAREKNIDPISLFHLLIENKPIKGCHTHSYGFHTANGRFLIETLQSYYYQYTNK